jgi:hypothetical protein
MVYVNGVVVANTADPWVEKFCEFPSIKNNSDKLRRQYFSKVFILNTIFFVYVINPYELTSESKINIYIYLQTFFLKY